MRLVPLYVRARARVCACLPVIVCARECAGASYGCGHVALSADRPSQRVGISLEAVEVVEPVDAGRRGGG